jgi:hypothetical protein
MSTPAPPKNRQVALDAEGNMADEAIAPLVRLVHRYGLTTMGSSAGGGQGEFGPAYLVFADAVMALEFLLQTAHLMDYTIGDRLALSVNRPLVGSEDGSPPPPGGKALWHPTFTPHLIQAWS